MALGPTQPPIQGVPRALSLGVKRSGREADHSPPSSAEVKECVELYIHSPNMPSWRGAQLKKAQEQLDLFNFNEVTLLWSTRKHSHKTVVINKQFHYFSALYMKINPGQRSETLANTKFKVELNVSLSPLQDTSCGCGGRRRALCIGRLAANMMNKWMRTTDKGRSSNLEVVCETNNTSP
jgi:hypothetical protein